MLVLQARKEWSAEKDRAVQSAVSSAREEWRRRLEEESKASVRHALSQARRETREGGGGLEDRVREC